MARASIFSKQGKDLFVKDFAEGFISMLDEKFLTQTKIISLAEAITGSKDPSPNMIICSQWEAMVNDVSMDLFRSPKHKEDFTKILRETLDTLNEQIEELILEEEENF